MEDPDFMDNLVRASEGVSLAEILEKKRPTRVDVGSLGACIIIGVSKAEELGILGFDDLRQPDDLCARAVYHRHNGRPDLAEADLRAALERDRLHLPSAYGLATVLALEARGRPDRAEEAVAALRGAWRAGWTHFDWTARDPDFAAVRELATFRELLEEAAVR